MIHFIKVVGLKINLPDQLDDWKPKKKIPSCYIRNDFERKDKYHRIRQHIVNRVDAIQFYLQNVFNCKNMPQILEPRTILRDHCFNQWSDPLETLSSGRMVLLYFFQYSGIDSPIKIFRNAEDLHATIIDRVSVVSI